MAVIKWLTLLIVFLKSDKMFLNCSWIFWKNRVATLLIMKLLFLSLRHCWKCINWAFIIEVTDGTMIHQLVKNLIADIHLWKVKTGTCFLGNIRSWTAYQKLDSLLETKFFDFFHNIFKWEQKLSLCLSFLFMIAKILCFLYFMIGFKIEWLKDWSDWILSQVSNSFREKFVQNVFVLFHL